MDPCLSLGMYNQRCYPSLCDYRWLFWHNFLQHLKASFWGNGVIFNPNFKNSISLCLLQVHFELFYGVTSSIISPIFGMYNFFHVFKHYIYFWTNEHVYWRYSESMRTYIWQQKCWYFCDPKVDPDPRVIDGSFLYIEKTLRKVYQSLVRILDLSLNLLSWSYCMELWVGNKEIPS